MHTCVLCVYNMCMVHMYMYVQCVHICTHVFSILCNMFMVYMHMYVEAIGGY